MKLIAIANILSDSKTIGFRLLDINSRLTKDVTVESTVASLRYRHVQIVNLELEDNKIIGRNGSIDRLPKIVDNQLIGKSPLIIINQIGEIGYTVSDYKGTVMKAKKQDVINYAKLHGIANGKLVEKDGTEFISAIEGRYKVEGTDILVNDKNEQLYTGELVLGIKPLGPIMVSKLERFSTTSRNRLITINGKTTTYNNVEPLLNLKPTDIKKKLMYEYNNYTLYNSIITEVAIYDRKNRKELVELIKRKEFRQSIDESISSMSAADGKKDKKTSLVIPTTEHKYYNVGVIQQIGDEPVYENLQESEILDYIEKLRVMKVRAYIQYNFPTKGKLALIRECSQNGISYHVREAKAMTTYWPKEHTLEEIYHYYNEYDNVIVDGKYITIVGMDAAYKYDMDIIHNTYGRMVVSSKKSAKAKAIGLTHIEDVTVNGDLKLLKTSFPRVEIPNNVKNIDDESIVISMENTELIFGSNIEQASRTMFKFDRSSINYIEIGTESAKPNILDALNIIKYHINKHVIHFNTTIRPEEYIQVIFNDTECVDITARNNQINDEFIINILKIIVQNELNNLNLVKKPLILCKNPSQGDRPPYYTIEYGYHELMEKYKTAKNAWNKIIKQHASDKLKTEGDKLFSTIDQKIQHRQQEAEDKIYKLNEKEVEKSEQKRLRKQAKRGYR